MMTGVSQQFCVRWNSHLGSLGAAFPELLAGQRFVDVTLACDGHQVHCHRLVLAACSSYFESLLNDNPCKHPIIILPKDVRLWEIQALVDFMYKGQVNVSQAGLPQLLKCAETLQIRGLCGTDSTLNEVSAKAERSNTNVATNLLPNCSSLNFSFATNFASNCQSEHENDEQHYNNNSGSHRTGGSSNANDKQSSTQRKRTKSNENLVKSKKTNANDIITKGISANRTVSGPSHGYAIDMKRTKTDANEQIDPTLDIAAELSTELHIKNEEIDSDTNNQDDGMDDDMDQSNSKIQSGHDQHDVGIMHLDKHYLNHNSSDSCTSKNDLNQSKTVQSHHDFDHDATTDRVHEIANSSDSDSHYSLGHKQPPSASPPSSTRLSIVADSNVPTKHSIDASSSTSSAAVTTTATNFCTPSSSIPSTSQRSNGGIRVKPIKNLFISGGHDQCVVDRSDQCHSEVHEMTTPINDLDVNVVNNADDKNSADPIRNWIETNSGQTKRIDDPMYMPGHDTAAADDVNVDFLADQYLPSSLKFNKNSMSIYVKSTTKDRTNRTDETNATQMFVGADDYENIICSPNFAQVPFMNNDDDDDDDEDGDDDDIESFCLNVESDSEAATSTPALTTQEHTMQRLKYMLTRNDAHRGRNSTATSIRRSEFDINHQQANNIPQLIPCEIVNKQYHHDQVHQSLNENDDTKDGDDDILLMPMQRKRVTPKRNRTADELRSINFMKMYQAAAAVAVNASKQNKTGIGHGMNPMRNAVVLRNPRGNQPRTYNTDALYAALMDVKSGESIYRASQIHKVPRKTLRNWMKRWDIKSVYPMPYQLKQAAEKKRQTVTKDNNPGKANK